LSLATPFNLQSAFYRWMGEKLSLSSVHQCPWLSVLGLPSFCTALHFPIEWWCFEKLSSVFQTSVNMDIAYLVLFQVTE
jgi:hypothetical protein